MEGALPSVVGGLVAVPVIAVPTSVGYGASFQGLSALLSMLNACAPGIAVVNIDNGFGAGYLASLILRQTPPAEEERFGKTMSVGADRVGQAIEDLRRRGEKTLSGETVFRLYDTFGIPIDLIEEIASDEGLAVDRPGFELQMEKHRGASSASANSHTTDD